jgi:DNA-binding transcriptional regulator YhcF (GntR family)
MYICLGVAGSCKKNGGKRYLVPKERDGGQRPSEFSAGAAVGADARGIADGGGDALYPANLQDPPKKYFRSQWLRPRAHITLYHRLTAMRFWFLHSNEVTIRQQIVTQIWLGILSGELAPGERLPSVRELARRFHLHANTVSAGYRQLEHDHWVQVRRGSGVYVRDTPPIAQPQSQPVLYIDHLIATLLQAARSANIPHAELRSRLLAAIDAAPPLRFLLVEPDPALQQIVLAEVVPALQLPVAATTLALLTAKNLDQTLVLVLPSKANAVREALPPATALHVLRIRSIPAALAAWLPAPLHTLVGVASHWPQFLDFARTMLVAAGFHPDALLLRDANQVNWRNGLNRPPESSATRTLPPCCHPPRPSSRFPCSRPRPSANFNSSVQPCPQYE